MQASLNVNQWLRLDLLARPLAIFGHADHGHAVAVVAP